MNNNREEVQSGVCRAAGYLDCLHRRLDGKGFSLRSDVLHGSQRYDLVASLVWQSNKSPALFTQFMFIVKIMEDKEAASITGFVEEAVCFGVENLQGPARLTTHFCFPVAVCRVELGDLSALFGANEDLCCADNTHVFPVFVSLCPKPGKVHLLNGHLDDADKGGASACFADAVNLITPE